MLSKRTVLLLPIVIAGTAFAGIACTMLQSTRLLSSTPTLQNDSLEEFYTTLGTRWVYSYIPYEPVEGKPTEIITATYIFTETVVDTQVVGRYDVVHVKREERLIQAPAEWGMTESSRPSEYWYMIVDRKVYMSFQNIDLSTIQTDTLLLAYTFPLTIGKSWCPGFEEIKGEKLPDCAGAGKRSVVSQGSYETPIGKFENCFEITEDVSSGGTTLWFCKGVGVVAQKYDHGGTRFGFSQVLVSYKKGVP
jgi:hypothetical protein